MGGAARPTRGVCADARLCLWRLSAPAARPLPASATARSGEHVGPLTAWRTTGTSDAGSPCALIRRKVQPRVNKQNGGAELATAQRRRWRCVDGAESLAHDSLRPAFTQL